MMIPRRGYGKSKRAMSLIRSGSPFTSKVGFPWAKDVFVNKALEIEHPLLSTSMATAGDSLGAMFRVLTRGVQATKDKRNEFVQLLKTWIEELEVN